MHVHGQATWRTLGRHSTGVGGGLAAPPNSRRLGCSSLLATLDFLPRLVELYFRGYVVSDISRSCDLPPLLAAALSNYSHGSQNTPLDSKAESGGYIALLFRSSSRGCALLHPFRSLIARIRRLQGWPLSLSFLPDPTHSPFGPSHVRRHRHVHANTARCFAFLLCRYIAVCCVRGHWLVLCVGRVQFDVSQME